MQKHTLHELGWNHYFQSQLDPETDLLSRPFRVTAVERDLVRCTGVDGNDQLHTVALPAALWRHLTAEERPVIGDWLLLDADHALQARLERRSILKRSTAGRESGVQLIGANIDRVLVVTSCNEEFNLNRLDRYISLVAQAGIECCLVLTKVDLAEQADTFHEALLKRYPDTVSERVNATDPASVEALRHQASSGETLALLGSSGVGKSTLVNSLLGRRVQSTGEIREADGKGRHTTTNRTLHLLPGGGVILDTPGMRELGLIDAGEGVRSLFADIETLARGCRFNNCLHMGEPGCAVLKAISDNRIDQERLDQYQKLLSEQARNSESLAQKRSRDRALGRYYRSAKSSSRRFKSR